MTNRANEDQVIGEGQLARDRYYNLPVPLDFLQPPLLIEHDVDGEVIPQRPTDGYINATLLCKKGGKQFGDYYRLGQTKAFLKELSLGSVVKSTWSKSSSPESGRWPSKKGSCWHTGLPLPATA